SRTDPATAVARTMVSPCRTTTAPEACLAILPVSKEISLPAISAETRVTASLLIFTAFLFRPSVGGPFSFSSVSELPELSGRGIASPRAAWGSGRRGLPAPAHDPVGAGDDERPLRRAPRARATHHDAATALGLLAEAELLDQSPVALEVAALQVVEKSPAAPHQHQQAAPGMVVLCLRAQVVGEVVDALGQQR